MEIELVMGDWVCNDEYLITNGLYGYEVYIYGTEDADSKEVFTSESFEECLTWIWNSL